MIYLTGVSTDWSRGGRPDMGLMATPASGVSAQIPQYASWAADNGCFSKGDQFDEGAWLEWLARIPRRHRASCLFAVAPDVLCDADATWQRSEPWFETIRALGYPVALVAQNGSECHAAMWDEEERWDALFIGGDTDWKLSQTAKDVMMEAWLVGKWCHMGRVNSWKRIELAARDGYHSTDGTFLAYGPTPNARRLEGWLDRLESAPPLITDRVEMSDEMDEAAAAQVYARIAALA